MIVSTSVGKVEGVERDGLVRFRGIPFAAPPVGERRFRPPAPVAPWSGILDASAYGAMAPQQVGGLEAIMGASSQARSEDCLYLNVVTPGCDDRRRPVMVWIHGGGFTSGAGSIPWYSGVRLAEKGDVVVVSVNYRLGALGFTHLADALGDDHEGSGNLGIADQVAALRWVRDEIAGFGGDPDRVTIFGESAGAMSVATLLATPAAKGLFRAAIAQSGAGHNVHGVDRAVAVRAVLLDELGLRDPADLLDVDVDRIVQAQAAVGLKALSADGPLADSSLGLPFSPVVDGTSLPRRPIDAVRAGEAADVALVAGTNADEFTLFSTVMGDMGLDRARLVKRIARASAVDPSRAEEAVAVYEADRPDASADDLWVAMATDWVFRVPCVRLLDAHAATGGRTWGYRFTWASSAIDGRLRSGHAVEIPFAFDIVDHPANQPVLGHVDDAARRVSATMSSLWLAVAHGAGPDQEGPDGAPYPFTEPAPAWPAWSAEERPVMVLGDPVGVATHVDADELAVWDEHLD